MTYVLLGVAIACEIIATSLLESTHGFTRFWPSLGSAVGYLIACVLLARVLLHMPVSVAYALWAGAGTAVVAVIGMTVLDEPASAIRIGGIVLIALGVVAVNLQTG